VDYADIFHRAVSYHEWEDWNWREMQLVLVSLCEFIGIVGNGVQTTGYGAYKSIAQSGSLLFIPIVGFIKLYFSRFKKEDVILGQSLL
jgi:hypothetical protein